MKNKKTLLVAHRGFSGKYPENTLLGFERAIANQCDMIELDIHLSKDGKLVVHHDFELGRTAKGQGLIMDYTAHDLQKLDAGSWFNSKFKTEKIPLLEEVLGLVKRQCSLNIEIKKETLLNEEAYDLMVTGLLKLLEQDQLLDNTIVSSFNWRALQKMRNKNSEVQLGLLNHEPEKGLKLEDAINIKPFSYHPNFKKINANMVNLLHTYELKVFPYTANTLEEFDQLQNLGVDGIITNEVEKLYHYLNQDEE